MGLLDFFKRETRAESIRASDPYLSEFFGFHDVAGYQTPDKAANHAVAQAAIRLIAETVSSVPLKLRRYRAEGGSTAASDHPLYGVLQEAFHDGMTAFAGRETLIASLLVHGNAYAKIERNGRGQVVELHPLTSGTVAVELIGNARPRYRVHDRRGGVEIVLAEDMLHIRMRTKDGIMGLSPIAEARETFGLALTQREQASAQARKGFNAAGAMVFPQVLGQEQVKQVRDSFQKNLIGVANTNKVMVLDGGAKFERFAVSGRDAEFLDSRKLSNLDVCRIFGVPPSAVGITDDATYSNIGEESRALVVRCLAPLAKRIEQQMNATLLTPESRKTLFIEHDMAGLLRGDMTARYEAYRVGREGGDEYLSPSHRAAHMQGQGGE
ncbi:phage portal protein [Fulvimarina sp. MAC3]|uniref:phage portal protein n=1 Tax=Fulvimarina sp. MAC3 TaxID=3148887 RepID=UPI0031FE30DA